MDIGRGIHQYQFAKIINSALQATHRARNNLDKESFKLTDEEYINLQKRKSGRLPLVVSPSNDAGQTVDAIISLIKA